MKTHRVHTHHDAHHLTRHDIDVDRRLRLARAAKRRTYTLMSLIALACVMIIIFS